MFYDDNGVRVSQHSISYPAGALSVHRVIDISIERETVDDRDGTHRFWKLVGKVVQFAGFGIAFLPFIAVMWTLVLTVLFYLGIEIELAPGDHVRNPNWSDYGPFEPEPWTFWAICGAGILSGLLVGLLGGWVTRLATPKKTKYCVALAVTGQDARVSLGHHDERESVERLASAIREAAYSVGNLSAGR